MHNERFIFTDENVTITISATSTNYKRNANTNTARMSIKIVPEKTSLVESCKNFERICFWDMAVYSVPENKVNGNKIIGSLGPKFYQKICPNVNVKYSLVNGKWKEYVWFIYNKAGGLLVEISPNFPQIGLLFPQNLLQTTGITEVSDLLLHSIIVLQSIDFKSFTYFNLFIIHFSI